MLSKMAAILTDVARRESELRPREVLRWPTWRHLLYVSELTHRGGETAPTLSVPRVVDRDALDFVVGVVGLGVHLPRDARGKADLSQTLTEARTSAIFAALGRSEATRDIGPR